MHRLLFRNSIFLLIGCILVGCSGNPEKKKVIHYKKALVYVEEKKADAAIIELRNAIQLDPKFADARYQLGMLYLKKGETRSAFEELQHAASLDPSNIDAKLKTAEFLLLARDKTGAKKHIEEILATHPQNIDALALHANILLIEGNFEDSVRAIDKAIALQPGLDRLYLTKGRIVIAQKKPQDAEQLFLKALELNPNKLANYQILVSYYQSRGEKDQALEIARTMVQKFPDTSEPLLLLAALHRDRGDEQKVEEIYREALSRYLKDIRLHMIAAEYFVQSGKFDQAESIYKTAVEHAEIPYDAKAQLADFYFEQKNFDLAKKNMADVLAKEGQHKGALLVKYKFLIKDGHNQDAITGLSSLLRDYPQWADAYFTKALAHMNLGEMELALNNLTEAVKFNPGDSKYHTTLAFFHIKGAHYEDAKKEAAIALKLQPKNFVAALLFAKSVLLAKDYDNAIAILKSMQGKLPDNVEVIGNLGLAYLGKHDLDAALQSFTQVLALQPGNTPGLVNVVRIRQQQGKTNEELVQLVRDQIKLAPDSAGHSMLLASMLLADKNYDEALQLTQKVQQLQPQNPTAYSLGADIYKRLDKIDQAINEYNKLLATGSNNIHAYMGLGALYEQKKERALAKKQYEEALKIDGNFAPAANNLAWILTEEAQPDLGEALRLALIAKQALPDDPNIIDTLGMVHYKRGSFTLARGEFSQAIEKRGDLPVFHYHLALALYGDNQKDKAIETLRETLDKGQPFAEKKEAEDTLGQWVNSDKQ